jgi:preprotein translocase subunit SecA
MFDALKKIFGGRTLAELHGVVDEINSLEPEIEKLGEEELKKESEKLRSEIRNGKSLEGAKPRAFALAREAARRTLKQRPYDVQLIGGLVLHKGAVSEMVTGEGKTLSAVAPAYLNALSGEGVHVVTVNEYLARRDAVWMGQIYRALGLSVACLVPNAAYLYDPEWKTEESALADKERDEKGNFIVQQEFLRPITRREAYLADITYGTNHEFGFDYLRDNLAYNLEMQVQRGWNFAIIDEVDSILIDEARTPLIISAPDVESSDAYRTFARLVSGLTSEKDYSVDEKLRTVSITEEGIRKVEKQIGVDNLYAPEHLRLVHYLEESLKAKALFERDRDYVVKNGEVLIVDEFTGRILIGRRYNGGLHQAIEAKEGVKVQEESRTYGKISIQNYFRLYKKISGMTGTAQTSAEEFHKVYNLEVVSIPTNRPLVRKDESDLIYKTAEAKWKAIAEDVKQRYEKGQPVLVGTTSISKNELASAFLSQAGIPHEVLNAKNNEREGAIIAQAGKLKAVTVATNVAGRGVDIILGGNPPSAEEAEKVKGLGGLHVVGTERHEARRIDNQLRGRAGRQGDPGSTQFFLALEDDLMRIFGGDRIKSLMERFNLPEDQPIQMGMVSKAVQESQARVEGANFDMRKHLLEYDDVLNQQRSAVYRKRQEILGSLNRNDLSLLVFDAAYGHLKNLMSAPEIEEKDDFWPEIKKQFEAAGVADQEHAWPEDPDEEKLKEFLTKRSVEASLDPQTLGRTLSIIDLLWMDHLENLEAVTESVGLRAYGQKDPLVEYREEAHHLYRDFWVNFDAWIFMNIFKLAQANTVSVGSARPANIPKTDSGLNVLAGEKIGRNDPCPCGSGKKYKKCHGA